MTEVERLLRVQLQQSQQNTIQMQSEHKAEVGALLEQLSGLQREWESSGKSYLALFKTQERDLAQYKQQIESAFQHFTQAAAEKETQTTKTLQQLENSLTALTTQLSSLTQQLKG